MQRVYAILHFAMRYEINIICMINIHPCFLPVFWVKSINDSIYVALYSHLHFVERVK